MRYDSEHYSVPVAEHRRRQCGPEEPGDDVIVRHDNCDGGALPMTKHDATSHRVRPLTWYDVARRHDGCQMTKHDESWRCSPLR